MQLQNNSEQKKQLNSNTKYSLIIIISEKNIFQNKRIWK